MNPGTRRGPRRALAVATLGLLTLTAACGGGDDGGDSDGTVTIANFAGAGITVPDQVAAAQGYFEDRGITPDFVQVTSAGTQLAALTSGSIDVAQNAVSQVMAAQQQGTDVKFFCGGVAKAWNVVMVKSDSEIETVEPTDWRAGFKALEGKTFGLDSLGAGQEASSAPWPTRPASTSTRSTWSPSEPSGRPLPPSAPVGWTRSSATPSCSSRRWPPATRGSPSTW